METNDTKSKLNLFKESNIFTHFELLDGTFYNGTIETVNENYVIIDDKKLGKFPILISEIRKIEPYEVRKS